ncbi:COX15/CtaA family protein [Ideonella sp. 4Y11]|uniref:COX15/CtaA family protein n=1 Tax=Ideonella aquatica TaxID=2824119 RepID=A0A940YLK2_9BURK|nr:COX15/CtaA family protein [Ideonella aquatica]MBQ0960201.1 COX15/CtaA family protein [Ideonella aquatica]
MLPDHSAAALFRLAAVGLAAAGLPLLWWLLRTRGADPQRRLAALTLLTLFLTFDLIVFGVFTRLTDSGLGCPDWPGCYGVASPIGAGAHIAAAEAAQPSGPVTLTKAWIEMLHRYLAMAVGLLILIGAVASWRHRRVLPHAWGWSAATLVWVIVQGLFGKYTVTLKLYPAIVTLHLLGAMLLLALLVVQQASFARQAAPPLPRLAPRVLGAALAVLTLQIALGGWVSTNYAVLACQDFPGCNGDGWPAMAWTQGFTLLRELGHAADGSILPFEALVAIHWTHRLFALMAALAVGTAAALLWRTPGWRRLGGWLAALLLLQLLTGLSNVVLRWPLLGALAHSAGAAAMVGLLVAAIARRRFSAASAA